MPDPASRLTWSTLPGFLTDLLSMPQNEGFVRRHGSVAVAVQNKVAEIRSGSDAPPQPKKFAGPNNFFRAVGAGNNPFGEWWFTEDQLLHVERIAKIHASADRREVIRACLREVTAVTTEWNAMTEIWRLSLPSHEHLTGLASIVRPQPKFQALSGGPMLVGGAEQIYFPVKNPLWVFRYA